jgi:hypothetical protein
MTYYQCLLAYLHLQWNLQPIEEILISFPD